jgi:hypothetical protein
MRQIIAVIVGLGVSGSFIQAREGHDNTVLEFNTMVGNSGPFIGTRNPIRGINAGGAAWTISEGQGELQANGELEVRVRGLVLIATGTNPVDQFRAIVSCLTIDGNGNVATSNVSTGLFPATPAGDAEIEERLQLPQTCFAPLVFVTSPREAWFAVTGF